MAEQRKFNAALNRKGLDNHVTVDQAREMAQHQGRTYLFIVAAHSGPKVVGEDGSESVSLVPDLVELVPADHEERVRQVQRAFYLARPEQHGQSAFDTAAEGDRDPGQALDDLDSIVQRDDSGEVTGVWDGDPDEPLMAETCPAPLCGKFIDHDGDHGPADA